MRPSLSIAIPSYNRTEKVYSLLEKLALIIPINVQSQIEIVISDNHSSIPIETLTHFIKYRVVKPEIHLSTAEENLAFLFRFLGGEYVWVLGDDDIPLERGFTKLWNEITNTNYDLIIFNSLTGDNNSNEIIRLSLIREKYEESLFKFASRAGMWSVLAGLSTLVFKREKFDLDYFDQLHKKNLYIYSHVFAILDSFMESKFVCVQEPIVFYQMNPYDNDTVTENKQSKHWLEYANKVKRPYRDPWTVSFLMQIKNLSERHNLNLSQFENFMDQGHIGNRFLLFDSVVAMFVDQLEISIREENSLFFSISELEFFYKTIGEIFQGHTIIREEIENIQRLFEIKDLDGLRSYKYSFYHPTSQIEKRRILGSNLGFTYFTAYGYLWSSTKIDIDQQLKFLDSAVGVLVSESKFQLENEVLRIVTSPEYQIIKGLGTINFEVISVVALRILGLKKFLPVWLRKFI